MELICCPGYIFCMLACAEFGRMALYQMWINVPLGLYWRKSILDTNNFKHGFAAKFDVMDKLLPVE